MQHSRGHRGAKKFGVSLILAPILVASCTKPPEPKISAAIAPKPAPIHGASVPKPSVMRFKKPEIVKGLYCTAWVAGGKTRLAEIIKLIQRTELNSMVIDIRDDGLNYFKMGIPLADDSNATSLAVPRPEWLMEKLESAKIYPIARIACFRDSKVPKRHPERAVQDENGGPWQDRSGHTWLDPYNQKNWEYIAAIVRFALDIGFPEIQLDYVRFPSEGNGSAQVFPSLDSRQDPEDVIKAFADYIGKIVRERKAAYSADIFGIISSTTSDQGIGQSLEKIAEPFDTISPMVYPSHFRKGEYGIPDPDTSPYAIIRKSLMDYKRRLPKKNVRPWLQDFSLQSHYGPVQLKAQIKAARDLGYQEFLLWNAGVKYTESGLSPKL